jgi:tetratricopeptide (TPR) repeat protein
VPVSKSLQVNVDVTIARFRSDELNDHEGAENLLLKSLAALGSKDRELQAILYRQLSITSSALRHFDVAFAYATRCLRLSLEEFEPNHSYVITAENNLAYAALEFGRLEMAEKYFLSARTKLAAKGEEYKARYLMVSFNLANLYLDNLRQPEQAISILADVVTQSEAYFAPGDTRLVKFRLALVRAHLDAKQCKLARSLVASLKLEPSLDKELGQRLTSCKA